MLNYDCSQIILSMDKEKINQMMQEVSDYKSNLVTNVTDIKISTGIKSYIDYCKENNIPCYYNVFNKTVTIEYTLELNLNLNNSEEWEIIEKNSDIILEQCKIVDDIIYEYETFNLEDI